MTHFKVNFNSGRHHVSRISWNLFLTFSFSEKIALKFKCFFKNQNLM